MKCNRCGKKVKSYYESDYGNILCDDCYHELEATPYGLGETTEDIRSWNHKHT